MGTENMTPSQRYFLALTHLRQARDLLKGANRAQARTRKAITSTEGAIRHASNREHERKHAALSVVSCLLLVLALAACSQGKVAGAPRQAIWADPGFDVQNAPVVGSGKITMKRRPRR